MANPVENLAMAKPDDLMAIELPFYYFGLNTSFKRFLAVTGLTMAILEITKPESLFNEDGSARGFLLTDKEDGVLIPFWGYSVALGALAAILV